MKKLILGLSILGVSTSTEAAQTKPLSFDKQIEYATRLMNIYFITSSIEIIPSIGSDYPNLDTLTALSTTNDILSAAYNLRHVLPKCLQKSSKSSKKNRKINENRKEPSPLSTAIQLLSASISSTFYMTFLYYHYQGDELRKRALWANQVPAHKTLDMLFTIVWAAQSSHTISILLAPYITKLKQLFVKKKRRKKKRTAQSGIPIVEHSAIA